MSHDIHIASHKHIHKKNLLTTKSNEASSDLTIVGMPQDHIRG